MTSRQQAYRAMPPLHEVAPIVIGEPERPPFDATLIVVAAIALLMGVALGFVLGWFW